jgi:hypothetical protein
VSCISCFRLQLRFRCVSVFRIAAFFSLPRRSPVGYKFVIEKSGGCRTHRSSALSNSDISVSLIASVTLLQGSLEDHGTRDAGMDVA